MTVKRIGMGSLTEEERKIGFVYLYSKDSIPRKPIALIAYI